MVPLQNDKVVQLLLPTSGTNAAVITTSSVDTRDFEDVLLFFNAGTVGTTFIPAITLQESDDNTTFTNIVALSGGSATSATVANLLTAKSAAKTTVDFLAHARKAGVRKRYLRATITPTTTQTWNAYAILAGRTSRALPDTAAERGADAYART